LGFNDLPLDWRSPSGSLARTPETRFGVQGPGFRVQGAGFRVQEVGVQ
jgi:hypothetical protein